MEDKMSDDGMKNRPFSTGEGIRGMRPGLRLLDIFREIITGDFDNSRQVAEEIAAGGQIHPLAKHVNRVADHKIDGLPVKYAADTFWVIEESYYEYPGKVVEIKPFLFNFWQGEGDTVLLKVYQFPAHIKKEDINNSNENLRLKFEELVPSPTFKGATYTYNKEEGTFSTHAPNDLGNGIKFTLIETFSKDKLIVMELLEKDGVRLTPYIDPIIYDRKTALNSSVG
jgi:hypothetical protein